MTTTRRILVVCLTFGLLMSVEILFHWYIGALKTPTSLWLKGIFLYVSPAGRHVLKGLVEVLIPSISLGILLGIYTTELRWWMSITLVLFASLLHTTLYCLESQLVPEVAHEWSSFSSTDFSGRIIAHFVVFSGITTVFYTGMIQIIHDRRKYHRRRSRKPKVSKKSG